jgi:hypothetical protein
MTLLVLLVLLTSELPDPGMPSTVTFFGGIGAFVGALVAHLRRLPSTSAGDATRMGMMIGVGTGLVGWTVALAIDRL